MRKNRVSLKSVNLPSPVGCKPRASQNIALFGVPENELEEASSKLKWSDSLNTFISPDFTCALYYDGVEKTTGTKWPLRSLKFGVTVSDNVAYNPNK